MSRFVLRYRGEGSAQTERAARCAAAAGARVLDVAGPMLLVECADRALASLRDALPDWTIVAERKAAARPRPPRPRLRAKAA
ncbi:MAG: hypothetical protein NZL99_10950 [Burkholderiaceae bacterium]|nr:hypothetical protein [Burkholderiaceae bacterium]MCX8004911.1 hypothetical protein [Burkholderiaceae bacterium]